MTTARSSHFAPLRRAFAVGVLAAVFAGAPTGDALAGGKIKLKLGTLAPEGSPWYNGMRRIADRWRDASKGQVELKIYPGGVAGDEGDTLRKIQIGQLDAATVTGVGLSRITRSSVAWQVPMMIESYEELDYVRSRMADAISKELEAGGYVVLNWGDAGWVHFFSKSPAKVPADIQAVRFFVWAGDPESEKAWKAGGFKTVPMSATDVMSSLQAGLIDSFSTTPLYALTSQWFGLAKYMVKINWAPLNGATIVSKKEWEKIDPELRKTLLAIAKEEGERTKAEVRALGDKAIDEMKKRGLTVYEPTKEEELLWRKTAESAYSVVRGEVVPTAFFDQVKGLVQEYRKSKGK